MTIKQPFNNKYTKYIKGALIINLKNLKKKKKRNYRLEKKIANYYPNKRLL